MAIVQIQGGAKVRRRIAVYGEIDPNLVDGSSVWLQSVCQVLASIEGSEVTLLLRRALQPERRFLLDALAAHESIELVDTGRRELLRGYEALDFLAELEREQGQFDVVLLRGQKVLAEAGLGRRFEGRLWSYAMTGRGMSDTTMRILASRSARMLCQTETVAEELREIVPEASESVLVLPPMIPDFDLSPGWGDEPGPLRLVYSGKLAPEYCWLETVEAFRALREEQPDAELHVLGDKVHRPPDQPDFHERAMHSLGETEGLHWQGAVPRTAVPALLAGCDLALSIRDPSVEAAREISTKVLEYGAAGLPVVLNRAPAYEQLLGADYPLFIKGPEDAAAVLTGPALDPDLRVAAATACNEASREFTFTRIATRLVEHLPEPAPQPTAAMPENVESPAPSGAGASVSRNGSVPTRVLIAGHDLKFTAPIREAITSTGAEIIEDVWHNHTEHDEAASRAALEKADVIFCEWCLGNAAWYSRNKRPDQRLVIRLHRVEAYTDHPAAVEIDNVDKVVCVSRHIADEVIERFGWDPAKLTVIPNAIDVDRFRLPKLESARHTLAMVGYVPKRKRLDRALDILEQLRPKEPRFRLLLVGQPPSELDWVARDPEEIDFFRRCYSRIQESDTLRGRITFIPFTDDLPRFFQRVGFVISTSESEGHQVALAEGAASGAVPVIINRPGVLDQYPARWVHPDADRAITSISSFEYPQFVQTQATAEAHAKGWSPDIVVPQWLEVLALKHLGIIHAPGRRNSPKRTVTAEDL